MWFELSYGIHWNSIAFIKGVFMNLRLILGLFSFLVFTNIAIAKDQSKKSKKNTDTSMNEPAGIESKEDSKNDSDFNKSNQNESNQVESSQNDSEMGSSEIARSTKWGGVSYKSGLGIGIIPVNGIDIYMNMNSRLQVGIGYSSGTLDLSSLILSDTTSKNKTDISVQLIDLYAKYFVGNSFAVTGGLTHRTIKSHIFVSSLTGSSSIDMNVSGSGVTGKIGIGNYWSWDGGFTLGCEWVGYLSPLTSSFSSKTVSVGIPSDSMDNVADDGKSLGRTFSKSGSYQLLNLAIGYSF